jgi:pimeloyl-ACP methyl ester carboxylesterase
MASFELSGHSATNASARSEATASLTLLLATFGRRISFRNCEGVLSDLAYSLHLERGDGYTISSVLETLANPWEKLDGKLAVLRAPTLILWGEDDAITPLPMARTLHREISGSRLQTIARCGHLPPLEQPVEFVAAVTGFLRPA